MCPLMRVKVEQQLCTNNMAVEMNWEQDQTPENCFFIFMKKKLQDQPHKSLVGGWRAKRGFKDCLQQSKIIQWYGAIVE